MPFVYRCDSCNHEHDQSSTWNLEDYALPCSHCGTQCCEMCLEEGYCIDCFEKHYDEDYDDCDLEWDDLDDDITGWEEG